MMFTHNRTAPAPAAAISSRVARTGRCAPEDTRAPGTHQVLAQARRREGAYPDVAIEENLQDTSRKMSSSVSHPAARARGTSLARSDVSRARKVSLRIASRTISLWDLPVALDSFFKAADSRSLSRTVRVVSMGAPSVLSCIVIHLSAP